MEMGGMCDELAMIDQDLNMTRRATRPFVPQADPAFNDLQRQVQLLETLPAAPIRPTRVNIDELLSTDSLPAPAEAGWHRRPDRHQILRPRQGPRKNQRIKVQRHLTLAPRVFLAV